MLKSGAQKKPEGTEQDFIEGLRVFDKDANSTISAAGKTTMLCILTIPYNLSQNSVTCSPASARS